MNPARTKRRRSTAATAALAGLGAIAISIALLASASGVETRVAADSPALEDHQPESVARVGNDVFVAVRVQLRQRASGSDRLTVFRITPEGNVTELPPAPGAGAIQDGAQIAISALNDQACVLFSVTNPQPNVSCFDVGAGSWYEPLSPRGALRPNEYVNDFTVRENTMFALAYDLRKRTQRVLYADAPGGAAWRQLGQTITGRNQIVMFNSPADANEETPTLSRERTTSGNWGTRAIFGLRGSRWRRATASIRALYPSQSGPAARPRSQRWTIASSRGVPELMPYGFFVRDYHQRRWRTFKPGNLVVTRSAYPQGNVGIGAGGTTWVVWSEQGQPKRGKIAISVYAARVLTRQGRVVSRTRLARNATNGFPPLPIVATLGAKTFAVFHAPVTVDGQTASRVRLVQLDGDQTIKLAE